MKWNKLQRHIVLCAVITLMLISITAPALAYTLENHYIANMATQYAWGANMSISSILKTGWTDAINAWSAEGMNISYSKLSRNLLYSEFRSGSPETGMSIITLYPGSGLTTVKEFQCYMNSASQDWNSTTAKSTATHELGHVMGLGHTSTFYAIMRDGRDRTAISTIQTDDRNGFNAIYN